MTRKAFKVTIEIVMALDADDDEAFANASSLVDEALEAGSLQDIVEDNPDVEARVLSAMSTKVEDVSGEWKDDLADVAEDDVPEDSDDLDGGSGPEWEARVLSLFLPWQKDAAREDLLFAIRDFCDETFQYLDADARGVVFLKKVLFDEPWEVRNRARGEAVYSGNFPQCEAFVRENDFVKDPLYYVQRIGV